MTNSNSTNSIDNNLSEDEISLVDILNFLLDSWKVIIGVGILGGAFASLFLLVTPNQYEATAQIQMAQISAMQSTSKNLSTLGVNIEDPNLLIARMKLPSSYKLQTAEVCFKTSNISELQKLEKLAKSVKISVPKGLTSVVEIKFAAGDTKVALTCLQELFEQIKKSQEAISAPFILEAQVKLNEYKDRLEKKQLIAKKADSSGAALSAAYLSTRDEIAFLTNEISNLEDFIASGNTRQTKLVAPIYVTDRPIYPKKSLTLILGLFGGLFAGLLFAIARKWFKDSRAKLRVT